MYASNQTHADRFYAVSEPYHNAFAEYMKYRNIAGSYYDLPSEAQKEIQNGIEELLRSPNSMPANAPRQALLAYHEAEKLCDQAKQTLSNDIKAVAHYLGVKPGSIEDISKDSIRIVEIADCHHHTLTIPRAHLTFEGMQQYKDHPILKDSPLWDKMLRASTGAEAAIEKAVPVVDNVSKVASGSEHVVHPVERGAAKGEQAAEGLWART